MALVVVAGAAMGVQAALLARQLDFKTQALAGGLAAVVAGSASITMALQGYGVWALVVQAVVNVRAELLAAVVASVAGGPRFVFSLDSCGSWLASAAITSHRLSWKPPTRRLFGLLAGKRLVQVRLGYYANAENTRQLPASLIGSGYTHCHPGVCAGPARARQDAAWPAVLANRVMMLSMRR
jgi:teichuronic acid exporter